MQLRRIVFIPIWKNEKIDQINTLFLVYVISTESSTDKNAEA